MASLYEPQSSPQDVDRIVILSDDSSSFHCGTIYVRTDGFTVEDQTYTVLCGGNFTAKVAEMKRKYEDEESRFFNIVEVTVYGKELGEHDRIRIPTNIYLSLSACTTSSPSFISHA